MKKRWLAVLLTLAMCLSLLPVTAVAEGESQLVMCEPDWDSESDRYIEEANKEYCVEENIALNSNNCKIFYFGSADDYAMIPFEDLTISGPIELEPVDETEVIESLNGFACYITGTEFGAGKVSYSVDGVSYSVTFQVVLPSWGIYSAAEATEANYCGLELPFSASKTDENGGYEEYYLISTNNREVQEITKRNEDDDISFLTVEVLEETPNIAKLTIREGFESGKQYRLKIHHNKGSNNLNLYINDTRPQLLMANPEWNNDDLLIEAENPNYITSQRLNLGGSRYCLFYFGNSDTNEMIKLEDLEVSGPIELQVLNEDKTTPALCGYAARVRSTGFGTGRVSYEMDGVEYTVTFSVQLPTYGLFSQQAYDEQYYIEDINLLDLKDNAVWLIHKDGFSVEDSQSISAEWLCKYEENYRPEVDPVATPVERTDDSGRYDIKITLPVAAASCQLQLSGPDVDEFWWVEMTGTSVQIGDYLIGYGSMEGDENNGFLIINPNDYNRNTNSENSSDERSGLGEWAIYAGTPTDQEDVYTPAPEVDIEINKVWIEVLEGEDTLLSWDEAVEPVITELTTFEDNICGSLYRLNAKEGIGVIYSDITVTIAGESTNHTIASVMVVEQVASNDNERPENDTVEKLNEYLQELKAKEADPHAESAHYEIYLADTTYEGEIIVPAFEKGTLFLYGAFGQGTVLEGCITMEEGANIHRVFDISFRATEEYKDYAITGGSGTIVDCSFYGYDVAIKSGRDYIRVAGNCAFVNNGIGYLHDSTDDYRETYGDGSFEECVFINNGTAIALKNWGENDPDPFNFRAYNSNFINNDLDFDVQVEGTFYFQANYFGYLVEAVSDADLLDWLNDRQLTNINEARRAAVVTAGNSANVITSPRWRNALDDMWWFKNNLSMDLYSPRTADNETEEENELICDWDTTTQIVNGEASDLMIDDSAFDIEGDQVIYVVDNEENPVVTWDFN